MNNLLSHCGLVDARISSSDKYLPVTARKSEKIPYMRISQTYNQYPKERTPKLFGRIFLLIFGKERHFQCGLALALFFRKKSASKVCSSGSAARYLHWGKRFSEFTIEYLSKRSIFQTFWKPDFGARFLCIALDASNFGYLLIFLFCWTVQSLRKIGQHLYYTFYKGPPFEFLVNYKNKKTSKGGPL